MNVKYWQLLANPTRRSNLKLGIEITDRLCISGQEHKAIWSLQDGTKRIDRLLGIRRELEQLRKLFGVLSLNEGIQCHNRSKITCRCSSDTHNRGLTIVIRRRVHEIVHDWFL